MEASNTAKKISAQLRGTIPTGFIGHVRAFVKALRISRERWWLVGLGLAVASVILLTAAGQVRLNKWQGGFYEALSNRDAHGFWMELMTFAVIVAVLIVLNFSQTWLQEMIKIRLRAGLTEDLLDEWLQPQKAYRLAMIGEIGVNPDQRMQEDARPLAELTASLAIGLFQASVLLVSFVGVLWALSDKVRFMIGGQMQPIPGYMVWCAFLYAAAGTGITWWVGRPLIRYNEEHYAREAELRFALVRVSEAAEGIALYGGEPAERGLLDMALTRVVSIMKSLANRLAGLTWVTAGYGYIAMVVPIVVASPGYFGGTLNFGELMMVVGAFNQVQSSLRWWVDNFPALADWRATFQRVMTLYDALITLTTIDREEPGIVIRQPSAALELHALAISVPNGIARLDPPEIKVEIGQHVQIVGAAGSGKAMLFRVIAGLWSTGTGTLDLPDRHSMMFMPQRPYLPLGTLAETLSYPLASDHFDRPALEAALSRVQLGHYVTDLAVTKRWDREMTLVEQHAVAFARALLQKPGWIVMEGVLETLEGQIGWVMDLMNDDLKTTAIVSIHSPTIDHQLFSQTFQLRLETLAPEAS